MASKLFHMLEFKTNLEWETVLHIETVFCQVTTHWRFCEFQFKLFHKNVNKTVYHSETGSCRLKPVKLKDHFA